MRYPINEAAYYIPVVIALEDIKTTCGTLEKDKEYPISMDNYFYGDIKPETHVFVMKNTKHACNILPVKISDKIRMSVKTIMPKFKLGDIVCGLDGKSPFRIYQYTIVHDEVWYRDGWGVGTNCESGRTESNIRLWEGDIDINNEGWAIIYNDNIMKEKQPQMYNVICPVHHKR